MFKQHLVKLTSGNGRQHLLESLKVAEGDGQGGHLNVALNNQAADEFAKLGKIAGFVLLSLGLLPPRLGDGRESR